MGLFSRHSALSILAVLSVLHGSRECLGDLDRAALDTVLHAIDDNSSRLQQFRASIEETIIHTPDTVDKVRGSKGKKAKVINGTQVLQLEYLQNHTTNIEIRKDNSRIRYSRKTPTLETHTLLDLEGNVTTYIPGQYATVTPFEGTLLNYGLKYLDSHTFGSPPASHRSLNDFLRSPDVSHSEFSERDGISFIIIMGELDSNSKVELWCSADAGYLPTKIATIWNSTGLYNFYASIDYDLVGNEKPGTWFPGLAVCRRPIAEDGFKSLHDQRWNEIPMDKTIIKVTNFELAPQFDSLAFAMPEYAKETDVRFGGSAAGYSEIDADSSSKDGHSRTWLIVNTTVVIALLIALIRKRFVPKAS